jgi:mannitol/fructose-specific phosphotransferase system IIA component (Ntr-type)
VAPDARADAGTPPAPIAPRDTMNLLDILVPESVRVPLLATTKQGAIDELVDLLAGLGRVQNPGALKDAVWTREQTRTTGIGHGVAFPHGKCLGLPRLAMAIGKPKEPMEFQAIDRKPVQVIILLASPPDKTSDHIQALARVSKFMSMDDFREKIYRAASAAEIYELIRAQDDAP